jgi:tetratricopeptide (TPR) repeat protein
MDEHVDRSRDTIPSPAGAKPDPGKNNVFFRICPNSDVVMIFVHGVLSDSRGCWGRNYGGQEVYWPALICEDPRLNGISIFLAGYETAIDSGSSTVRDASKTVWTAISESFTDKKRVLDYKVLLFVCHSQGGIVVRDMLVRQRDHLRNTEQIGLLLLGSPSVGSWYATLVWPLAFVLGNSQAQQLRYGSITLDFLDDDFVRLKNEDSRIVGFEGYEHFGPLHSKLFPWVPAIVSKRSGGRYFDYKLLPRTDHFTVAKPTSLDDPQHKLLVVDFLQQKMGLAKGASALGSPVYPLNSRPSTLSGAIRRFAWLRAVALLGLFAAVILLWFQFFTHKPVLWETDTVLLGDFKNSTGDSVFDGGLRQGLAAQLDQSPFLALVPDARVEQTLRMMGKPVGVQITSEIAIEVCQRTGAQAVIDGTISRLGSTYQLVLMAKNCETGEVLATAASDASARNRVLRALGNVASGLRRKLGESPSTLNQYATAVEEATTPSLEALKAYSLGRKQMVALSDSAAAVPFFVNAIELDTDFAMAYATLGTCYFNLGEKTLAAENTLKAYTRQSRVSNKERLYIKSHYYHLATGDLLSARDVYRTWRQLYPRDSIPATNLGAIFTELGQHEEALQSYKEGLALAPNSGINYGSLFVTYVDLNRFADARATLEEMQKNSISSPDVRHHLYQLAFFENDLLGMAEQVKWALGTPDEGHVLLHLEAETSAYNGRMSKAREFTNRAILALRNKRDGIESIAAYESAAALREALVGNRPQALSLAIAALKHSRGRDVQYAVCLAMAFVAGKRTGQSSVAELADDLAKRFPEDTIVSRHFLPTIRAKLLLNSGSAAGAIEMLQSASAYELGVPGVTSFSPNLYPVYVRGEAYLSSGQGPEARTEFQKIIDHPGLAFNGPLSALAKLGIARSYAREGNRVKAREAYDQFLGFWSKADQDSIVLNVAKEEYARSKQDN